MKSSWFNCRQCGRTKKVSVFLLGKLMISSSSGHKNFQRKTSKTKECYLVISLIVDFYFLTFPDWFDPFYGVLLIWKSTCMKWAEAVFQSKTIEPGSFVWRHIFKTKIRIRKTSCNSTWSPFNHLEVEPWCNLPYRKWQNNFFKYINIFFYKNQRKPVGYFSGCMKLVCLTCFSFCAAAVRLPVCLACCVQFDTSSIRNRPEAYF